VLRTRSPKDEATRWPICPGIAGTVWLYGDSKTCPGLLGFLTSARKEHKGDRLRAVLSWGGPGVEADFDSLVDSARMLDLAVNVFDPTGQCGIYAPKKTQVSGPHPSPPPILTPPALTLTIS
jgi:hypothetical protein